MSDWIYFILILFGLVVIGILISLFIFWSLERKAEKEFDEAWKHGEPVNIVNPPYKDNLHKHKWSKWKRVTYQITYDKKVERQERFCIECEFIQQKRLD